MATNAGCLVRLSAGEFSLHPLDLERDTDALHGWMNDPEVARFWEMAWPRDAIARYLRQRLDCTHSTSYVGLLDGVAMSYWELYRADLDPLADHYPARDGDAGVHLLLGPSSYRGLGIGVDLLRAVAGWQLEGTERVVAEPDVRNVRSLRAFERAGFRRTADIDLPDKRAALMIRDRGAV